MQNIYWGWLTSTGTNQPRFRLRLTNYPDKEYNAKDGPTKLKKKKHDCNSTYWTIKTIENFGLGNDEIQAWDPDSEQYKSVTWMTYGGEEPVKLYTDEP